VRITEKDNNVVQSDKLYFWLGGQIVCERDALQPGNPIAKRFFGQGVIQGSTKLYYTFDQLGSVRELVDAAGVVRADYRYSTYGERTKVGGDLDSDWGWAGLWHHEPSGLDLATYRVYDPEMGRWLSRDPLGEGTDRTLYSYCANNPINFADPAGLQGSLTPIVRSVDGAGNAVFTQQANYSGLTVQPQPQDGSPSSGPVSNQSAPTSPGNHMHPGTGGTWWENSVLQTHRDGNAASVGDIFTGAEETARTTVGTAAMILPGVWVGRSTTGLRWTGSYTKHGLNQKISRCINTPQIKDALLHPRARPLWQEAQATWLIEGKNGVTVILNEAGDIVTTWKGRRPP